MLYHMHEHIMKPYIGIAGFHSVAILLDEGVCPLDPCSKGLKSPVDDSVR